MYTSVFIFRYKHTLCILIGDYAFVVGIQYDIGETEGSQERLAIMQKLLSKIPDRVEDRVETF
jgi:hypothetical protein